MVCTSVGPSHGVGSSGCILVAHVLSFAVGTVVSSDDAIAVAPTVAGGVQSEHPGGMVEFGTSTMVGRRFVVGIRFWFGYLLLFRLG
jgi:hypothetical protein